MERSPLEQMQDQKIDLLRLEYERYRDARRKLFMTRMMKGIHTPSEEEKKLKKQMDAAYDLYQHELTMGGLEWNSEKGHLNDSKS